MGLFSGETEPSRLQTQWGMVHLGAEHWDKVPVYMTNCATVSLLPLSV